MKGFGTLYMCEESDYPSQGDKKYFQNQYPSFLPLALLGKKCMAQLLEQPLYFYPVNS